MNISIFSSFIPYAVLLVFCTVIDNYVTSGNDNPKHPHWFFIVFAEVVVYLGKCSSYDMDYIYGTDSPECWIITMYPMVYQVITTATKNTHYFTKNLIHW